MTGRQGYTVTEGGIAVVPVLGPLVTRGDWLTTLLGATEYGAVADALTAAADDPAVRGILLEVDSPGGEVGGLFDLVETIGAIKQHPASRCGRSLPKRAVGGLRHRLGRRPALRHPHRRGGLGRRRRRAHRRERAPTRWPG